MRAAHAPYSLQCCRKRTLNCPEFMLSQIGLTLHSYVCPLSVSPCYSSWRLMYPRGFMFLTGLICKGHPTFHGRVTGLQGGEWGPDGPAGGMGDRGRGRGGVVPRGRFGGFGSRFEGSGGRSEGGRFEGSFRGRGVPIRGRGGRSGDSICMCLARAHQWCLPHCLLIFLQSSICSKSCCGVRDMLAATALGSSWL